MNRFTLFASKTAQRLAGYLVVAASLLTLNGCQNNSVAEIEDLETVALFSQSDLLAQTMEYIRSVERYEMEEFRDKVNSGLNRWITHLDEEPAPSWQLPELVKQLPEAIKNEPVFGHLDDLNFYSNDAHYLQESYWLREVADRIVDSDFVFHHEYLFQLARHRAEQATLDEWEENRENLLQNAMALIHPELAENESAIDSLTQAVKLFDWSVRNVHLEEARPWPDEEIVQEMALVEGAEASTWPAVTGTPGPGYLRFPWQVLTYAKGDFLDRARTFVGLCRQVDIPVAVLALPPKSGAGRPYREWCCAALIDDKFYLFDPLLGLPIHGEREGSIATLSEVKEKPELLSRMDLTPEESVEEMDYRVTADQLNQVIALVAAPPESVSRRMQAVESRLTGNNRLKLTVPVDELAEAFASHPLIDRSTLWHAPFSTHIYRARVADAAITAEFDPNVRQRISWLIQDERYIDSFVMFRTARSCFLLGIFENDLDNNIRSAISYYYRFMYTDQDISDIEVDPRLQKRLGILRDVNQSFQDWENRLKSMQASMTRVRADSAFFLAICNYEIGMSPTAIRWFERIRIYDREDLWKQYLPYHKGRALESTGRYDQAGAFYQTDESAQKHGSILRARWMDRLESLDDSDRS